MPTLSVNIPLSNTQMKGLKKVAGVKDPKEIIVAWVQKQADFWAQKVRDDVHHQLDPMVDFYVKASDAKVAQAQILIDQATAVLKG